MKTKKQSLKPWRTDKELKKQLIERRGFTERGAENLIENFWETMIFARLARPEQRVKE